MTAGNEPGMDSRKTPGLDAGRSAIRGFVAGFSRRGDPYAGADRANAVRIVALIWLLSGTVTAIFLPFDPPTRELGDAGWIAAAAIIVSELAGGILLRRRGGGVGFDGLLAITYIGLAQTAVMIWLGSGWESPYSQLMLVWIGSAAGVHPPRRALTVLLVTAAVAFAPALYLGWSSGGAENAATELLLWMILGLLVVVLMTYVRGQRVALRDKSAAATRLANVDALTGLPNRRAFDERLEIEIGGARRAGTALSIALLDLDGFKDLNDRLGHLEGDSCLREIATVLDRERRHGDQVFRWGGDEFAVILPGADHREAAAAVKRLSELEPPVYASDGLRLSFCAGVAELESGMTARELFGRADLELFGAKGSKAADEASSDRYQPPA